MAIPSGVGGRLPAPRAGSGWLIGIRGAYAAMVAEDASFDPARPVATNPVQRRPPVEGDRVWIAAPDAAAVLDLANATYNHMLRILGSVYDEAAAA